MWDPDCTNTQGGTKRYLCIEPRTIASWEAISAQVSENDARTILHPMSMNLWDCTNLYSAEPVRAQSKETGTHPVSKPSLCCSQMWITYTSQEVSSWQGHLWHHCTRYAKHRVYKAEPLQSSSCLPESARDSNGCWKCTWRDCLEYVIDVHLHLPSEQ